MNAKTAIQRFLETTSIHNVSNNNIEGFAKYSPCLIAISRHDPYSETVFFQMPSNGFSQPSGCTYNQDSLVHDYVLFMLFVKAKPMMKEKSGGLSYTHALLPYYTQHL